jgi:hypothetical protein
MEEWFGGAGYNDRKLVKKYDLCRKSYYNQRLTAFTNPEKFFEI